MTGSDAGQHLPTCLLHNKPIQIEGSIIDEKTEYLRKLPGYVGKMQPLHRIYVDARDVTETEQAKSAEWTG